MKLHFEDIWKNYHLSLFNFIKIKVSDESSAEDMLQDVALKLHKAIEEKREINFLQDTEKKSNARIKVMFDAAEVRMYGSQKEIDNALQPIE